MTLLGRYQLGRPLGRGGMGEVRAGRDLRLERDVAVKMLNPALASQPTIRRRFEVEARAAACLVHPHVVAVFDSGEEAGIPFLVMERLDGRTLADAIEDGPMEPGALRQLGLQILSAISAAHAAGLMHRDIKPANVLAAGPGNWKVGDFGIAKSVDAADPALTAAGLIVGTPAYVAPERLAGGPATPSGDIYAVGIVLYEAARGPRGPGRAPALGRPLPPLDQVRPGLPADLVAIISRAMAPDPSARFGSAAEMAAWLSGRGAATVPAPGSSPAASLRPDPAFAATAALGAKAAATEVLPGPPEPANLSTPAPSRRRTVFAAVIGAAALIVVTLAISLGGGTTTSNATPRPPATSTTTSTTAAVATTTLAPRAPAPAVVASSSGHAKPNGAKGHGKHGGR
jgi:serine/threonine-protein kinase